jgi:hypothetical protein
MDAFDKLALLARRYEKQHVARLGTTRYSLGDVLEAFARSAILELTPYSDGRSGATVRPDPVRKHKVSLLDDGFSAIGSGSGDWYEVLKTPPSGDLAKVRILAYGPDNTRKGELRLLVGPRSFDHYFVEDPILGELSKS